MSKGYEVQGKVVQASTVFMNWLSQYANTSGADDSKALGFAEAGARSQINLKFEVSALSGAGTTSILFKDKNLLNFSSEDLSGAKPEDFKLLIQLNISEDNTDNGVNAGDKLLTIGHETMLHGESQSQLLLDFFSGKTDGVGLIDGYKSNVDGGGEIDHLKITPGTSKEYTGFVTDINNVLFYDRSLDKPYKDLKKEERGFPREGELLKIYGKTSPGRNFSNGYVNLSDDFRHAVDLEKTFQYNPAKRGFKGNYLKEKP